MHCAPLVTAVGYVWPVDLGVCAALRSCSSFTSLLPWRRCLTANLCRHLWHSHWIHQMTGGMSRRWGFEVCVWRV